LVFERTMPDLELLRRLWLLLPDSTRSRLWPATFAFDDATSFHAVVVRRVQIGTFSGYLYEVQAGDYPEGAYERSLQVAVEAGDQSELNRLFTRRSPSQTLRLALLLVAGMAILAVAMQLLNRALDTSHRAGPAAGHHAPNTKRTPQ
jgi:hypothetical protein